MAEHTVTEVEIAKDLPDYKGKGAKVYRLTIEGEERKPEMFVMNDATAPIPGKLEGEIENGEYGPKFVKAGGRGSGGGGGFKKSPEQEKRIVRQHSAEMALMREANLIAAGGKPLTGDELHSLINWFVSDAYGKAKGGVMIDGTTSDVPADTLDLAP